MTDYSVIALLFLFSCGQRAVVGPQGSKGDTGAQGASGSNGVNGATGPQGPSGNDGTNGVDGLDGQDGTDGVNGQDGQDGSQGSQGLPGSNGHSVYVQATGISPISCTNGGNTFFLYTDLNDNALFDVLIDSTPLYITTCNGLNGSDGSDGQDGEDGSDGLDGQDGATGPQGPIGPSGPPTAFTPVAIVNPCGDAPGIYDEVFLKLADGTLLASFSDSASGLNTRFSLLGAGTFQTTDNDSCVFTVNASGDITYENHHY